MSQVSQRPFWSSFLLDFRDLQLKKALSNLCFQNAQVTYWAAASIDSSVISLLFVLSSVFYSGSTVSNNNIGLRHES